MEIYCVLEKYFRKSEREREKDREKELLKISFKKIRDIGKDR